MSSTRRIVGVLKITSIASINLGIVYAGVREHRRHQEIARSLPEEERVKFAADPLNQIGNSGDAMAVFNSRTHR